MLIGVGSFVYYQGEEHGHKPPYAYTHQRHKEWPCVYVFIREAGNNSLVAIGGMATGLSSTSSSGLKKSTMSEVQSCW